MNEELKHRLYHYQTLPPAGVWNKITDDLDDAELNLADRLKNYEVGAPIQVWNNIVAELDNPQAPVVAFFRGYARPLKYGIAAASLIFAVILVNLVFLKKSVSESASSTPTNNPPNAVQGLTTSPIANDVAQSNEDEFGELAYSEREKNIPVRLKHLKANKVKPTPAIAELRSNQTPAIESDFLERYSIFSTNDGESFRVSKKLFDLFLCSEINEYCKLNIEMVKGKVASPSVIASADFSGVLDLLQSMNNQQNR